MAKGLICQVYRCSFGALDGLANFSSQFDTVVLTGSDMPELFEPTPTCPEVILGSRFPKERYIYCHPKSYEGMFSGTYIYTSDSRFPSRYPIPLHDRIENKNEQREKEAT